MSSKLPNDEALRANGEALRALASNPDAGVVVMLNLLKFKGEEGVQAYNRYMELSKKTVEAHGGRIVYAGRTSELLVGNETWDAILLVEYPSRKVFLEMVGSPEYRAAHVYREQGLERTVVYATSPIGEW